MGRKREERRKNGGKWERGKEEVERGEMSVR